jgi:hypothetical protein
VQENWIPKGRLQRKKIPRTTTISNGLSEFLAIEQSENQKTSEPFYSGLHVELPKVSDYNIFCQPERYWTSVLLRKINSDVKKAEEQRLLGEHISKVM